MKAFWLVLAFGLFAGTAWAQVPPGGGAKSPGASPSAPSYIAGFTPNGYTGTPQTVTTTSSSGNLPTGSSVLFQNVGANTVYVHLGTNGSVQASLSDIAITPGAAITLVAGSNTTFAAITAVGTSTLNMAGGTGQLAGYGTGGYVTQGPGGSPLYPWYDSTPDAVQSPSASFTRPANTTAYASGYLVANSTTAGSVVAPSWSTLVRAAGDCVRIERIRMTASSGSVTNGSFRVYIFNSVPTVTSGDGAAFDASGVLNTNAVDNMAGNFNVTFQYSGSDGAVGYGIPSTGSGVTACPTSGTAVYALVEATAAWTPPSASVITLYPELWKP